MNQNVVLYIHETNDAEIKLSYAYTESRGEVEAWLRCRADKWTAEGTVKGAGRL